MDRKEKEKNAFYNWLSDIIALYLIWGAGNWPKGLGQNHAQIALAWSGLLASFVVTSIINPPHCAHYRCSHRLCCFILPWRAQQCFFLSQHALCYVSSRAVFQASLSPRRGAGSGAWFGFWCQRDCWEWLCRIGSPSEPDDTLKATHRP